MTQVRDEPWAGGRFLDLDLPEGPTRVHYYELGQGERWLLLVQTGGNATTAYMSWRLNLPRFADAGYHVVAPDMPGFGQTLVAATPGRRANPVEFLTRFMDALRVEAPHLIGNSMGSNALTRLAIERPERVRSLVLTGGEPRVDTEGARAISPGLSHTPRSEFVRQMLSQPQVRRADMRRATADFFYDDQHPAIEWVTNLRMEQMGRPGVHEAERDREISQADRGRAMYTTADLARIRAPTYLVHGRDERFFYSAEQAPVLLDAAIKACLAIPNCSCTLLAHCGHWPQIERADRFNALALEFLRSVE